MRISIDLAFLAPDRAEKLDLYLPPSPPPDGSLAPGFVWIHGGGWTGGTKSEARAHNLCTELARAGYVTATFNFRLGRKPPLPGDVKAVVLEFLARNLR